MSAEMAGIEGSEFMSSNGAPERYYNPAGFRTPLPPSLSRFDEVRSLSVRFLTDRARLQALLPEFFEVPTDPVVTVAHAHNIGVDWLGGRSYQLARVDTQVTFRGKEETVSGPFSMAVWESDAKPVILGRELQGYQKMVGNVPEHRISGSDAEFECYEYDARLFRAELHGLEPISQATMEKMQVGWNRPENMALGWKYIPNAEGGEDANYVTRLPMGGTFCEVLRGTGELVFDSPSWQEAPGSAHIVAALRTLPVLEYRSASMARMVDVTLPRDQVRIVR